MNFAAAKKQIPSPAGGAARNSRRRRFFRRDLPATVALLLLAMLAALRLVGLPSGIRDVALRRLNHDRRYVLDVRSIRFRFPFGLYLDDLQLYRRGTIGPPILEAERVSLTVNPGQWRHRITGIRHIIVENGIIRRYPPAPDPPLHPKPWRLPDGEQSRVEFRNLNVTGLHIAHGSMDCRVEGPWLWIDNGRAVPAPDGEAGSVTLRGALHLAQRRYQGTAEGTFLPEALLPLTEAWGVNAQPMMEPLDAGGPLPDVNLRFEGVIGPPQHIFSGDGTLRADRFRYHGIALEKLIANGSYRYDGTESLLEIRHAVGMTETGTLMGRATFAFEDDTVDVDVTGTTSPLIPVALVGLPIPEFLQALRFEGTTRWKVEGPVTYRGEGKTDLAMQCEAQQVAMRNIELGQTGFRGHYDGRLLNFHDIQASILEGKVNGSFAIETADTGSAPDYHFDLRMEQLNFQKLIAAVNPDRDPDFYEGLFSIDLNGNGKAVPDWLPELMAGGSMRIRQGRLFRLPLFGGLSQMLTRIIPGLDVVLMQTGARADFTIANNRLNVSDGRIQGEVFHVEGRGVYTFGEALNFQVQLKLMGDQTLLGSAVRTVTFPLSKLFEFRLSGSLEEPRWYPVNFSADLLRGLRDSNE